MCGSAQAAVKIEFLAKTESLKMQRTFRTMKVSSAVMCCAACSIEEVCKSVSYERSSGQCELSSDDNVTADGVLNPAWDVYSVETNTSGRIFNLVLCITNDNVLLFLVVFIIIINYH